ncbi:hypothetical protein CspHIS471_0302570 [Cutaneotrichosporon sp. HIS471]|nr:hypothetical protein CspHIS471_0302570 [Cutaneotrichosporon sp. HIS471]
MAVVPRPRKVSALSTTLNLASFPHILDAILGTLDHQSLAPLRQICTGFRDKIDPKIFAHVVVAPFRFASPPDSFFYGPELTSWPNIRPWKNKRVRKSIKVLDILPAMSRHHQLILPFRKLPKLKWLRILGSLSLKSWSPDGLNDENQIRAETYVTWVGGVRNFPTALNAFCNRFVLVIKGQIETLATDIMLAYWQQSVFILEDEWWEVDHDSLPSPCQCGNCEPCFDQSCCACLLSVSDAGDLLKWFSTFLGIGVAREPFNLTWAKFVGFDKLLQWVHGPDRKVARKAFIDFTYRRYDADAEMDMLVQFLTLEQYINEVGEEQVAMMTTTAYPTVWDTEEWDDVEQSEDEDEDEYEV